MNELNDSDEHPPAESPFSGKPKTFEDLTLAQALEYLIWRPIHTARLLWQVLTRDPGAPPEEADFDEDHKDEWPGDDQEQPEVEEGEEPEEPDTDSQARLWVRIAALAAAVLLAMRGGHVLQNAALDPVMKAQQDTGNAAFWFVLAGVVLVGAESWISRAWWAARFPRTAGWIRAQFEMNPLWNAGVIVPLLVLLVLLFTSGDVVFSAIVLALIAALWLMLLLGRTPAGRTINENDEPQRTQRAQSFWEGEEREGQFAIHQANGPLNPAVNRSFLAWLDVHAYQLLLVPAALFFSALTYTLNVQRDPATDRVRDVVITTWGFTAWVISVGLWITLLAADPRRVVRGFLKRFTSLLSLLSTRGEGTSTAAFSASAFMDARWWIVLAVVSVTALGAAFRLHDLSSTPPEMTSDHIEKLLDALRVHEGYRGIFFPNNGGREGFQMYAVALIAQLPGVGFSFDALKLATVIEGVITLPALWWMARQVVGTDTEERRRLGNWIGIALAGLVAISAWHVMLSRLGLRIVLTPFTTVLVIGFLARAMRHNRMQDYLALGIALGVGAYFYQANRMLPVVVVIGIGLALWSRARRPQDAVTLVGEVIGFAAVVLTPLAAAAYLAGALEESSRASLQGAGERLSAFLPLVAMAWFSLLALAVRGRRDDPLLQYGGGLLVTAVVALALYIPMYHYAEINPDQFWNRMRGRMFGDDAFVRLDPDSGGLVAYEPSLREQAERFWDQRSVFVENYKNALEMFHWQGDGLWFNNPPGYPALDGAAGGLMILGLVAWGVLVARHRDPALGLLPVSILVMLLSSAMALAHPTENPSFTRSSGALPGAFMIAALPLGALCGEVSRVSVRSVRVPVGIIVALAIIAGLLWYGIGWNVERFFTDYRLNYSYSWKPYHEIAKPMREFAQSEGSYGNAFMVAYTHWLDHRILGTVAGDIRWPNGLVTRDDLIPMIRRNRGTPYQYDPAKPLFVMYHIEDLETAAYLDSMFPGGQHAVYEYRYETLEPGFFSQGMFSIFTVQAGEIALE